MKTRWLFALVYSASAAWAQTQPAVPVTTPVTPIYDSPLVKIIGDGRPAPNLAPVASIPEFPTPPQPWGPRAFDAFGKFKNSSFRATVGTNSPIIGGLVIGEGGSIVLIRAVGPSLASFGISNFLPRPQLQIFDSAGRIVATAVAWSANPYAIREELKQTAGLVGAFPLREGSDDQVLLVFLQRGSYSCVVSGDSGVVLFEAFDVPSDSRGR